MLDLSAAVHHPNLSTPVRWLISIAFSLATTAIIVPVVGVLVRYRANYNPKSVQLDSETGATVHTGSEVTSYFGMMKRVYYIEASHFGCA